MTIPAVAGKHCSTLISPIAACYVDVYFFRCSNGFLLQLKMPDKYANYYIMLISLDCHLIVSTLIMLNIS